MRPTIGAWTLPSACPVTQGYYSREVFRVSTCYRALSLWLACPPPLPPARQAPAGGEVTRPGYRRRGVPGGLPGRPGPRRDTPEWPRDSEGGRDSREGGPPGWVGLLAE